MYPGGFLNDSPSNPPSPNPCSVSPARTPSFKSVGSIGSMSTSITSQPLSSNHEVRLRLHSFTPFSSSPEISVLSMVGVRGRNYLASDFHHSRRDISCFVSGNILFRFVDTPTACALERSPKRKCCFVRSWDCNVFVGCRCK